MPQTSFDFQLLGALIPSGLLIFIAAAALGAPITAACLEYAGRSRRKIFLDKLAAQVASMGALFSICVLIAGAAVTAWTFSAHPGLLPDSTVPFAAIGWGGFAITAALSAAYAWSWKAMKQAKGAHMALGVLAGLAGLDCVPLIIGLKRAVLFSPEVFSEFSSVIDGFISLYAMPTASAFWPLAALGMLVSMSAAGALALIWLLLRRKVEDYGRDYYAYAHGIAGKWAAIVMLPAIAALGWLAAAWPGGIGPVSLGNPAAVGLCGAAAAYLLGAACWGHIGWSKAPLRQKPVAIIGAFTIPAGAAFQTYPLLLMLIQA